MDIVPAVIGIKCCHFSAALMGVRASTGHAAVSQVIQGAAVRPTSESASAIPARMGVSAWT